MVKAPAIFLRVGCVLPDGLQLEHMPFDTAWTTVENTAPTQLDLAVRSAGWHFMWIEFACSRDGCGGTDRTAATRAIARALTRIPNRFNAAELRSVGVAKYLGLRIAKATLHARHIQQDTSLGWIAGITIRELAPE